MDKDNKPSSDSAKVPNRGTAIMLFATIADTTWRMFTPVLLLLVGGLWLDGKTGHKPLFTLIGAILGFALAIALVYQQYKEVTPRGDKK